MHTCVDKVEQHKKICLGLNSLYAKKNSDYGDSFHQSYLEEGLAMPRIRIGDKFSRFKTLSKKPDAQQVEDESIRDTLLDLANYAIMTVLEMDAESQTIGYLNDKDVEQYKIAAPQPEPSSPSQDPNEWRQVPITQLHV